MSDGSDRTTLMGIYAAGQITSSNPPRESSRLATRVLATTARQLLAEARARVAARQECEAAGRRAMSPEQLMKLERQIEALKERGSWGEDVANGCANCAVALPGQRGGRRLKPFQPHQRPRRGWREP